MVALGIGKLVLVDAEIELRTSEWIAAVKHRPATVAAVHAYGRYDA